MTIFRFVNIVLLVFANVILYWSYVVNGEVGWFFTYCVVLSLATLVIIENYNRIFLIGVLFVIINFVAITFPVVPYLIFLHPVINFYRSIELNSLGFLTMMLGWVVFAPQDKLILNISQVFKGDAWRKFADINYRIFLFSLPFILLVQVVSGGWRVLFFGLANSGFDRVSSLQGLGALMIFNYMLMYGATFLSLYLFFNDKKTLGITILAFSIFITGFTGGRGNLIWVFLVLFFFYGVTRGISVKSIIFALGGGILIVLSHSFRSSGVGVGELQLPWYVNFFMNFAGDFDSVNNTAKMISYTDNGNYFGLYHIWSNILVYVPRVLYPDKPYELGGLYLDGILFPNVYQGAAGGTGYSFGYIATWFAVDGLLTMFIGCFLIGAVIGKLDMVQAKNISKSYPSYSLLFYLFLLGQLIILYRDGIYAFMNVFVYLSIYLLFYKVVERIFYANTSTSGKMVNSR